MRGDGLLQRSRHRDSGWGGGGGSRDDEWGRGRRVHGMVRAAAEDFLHECGEYFFFFVGRSRELGNLLGTFVLSLYGYSTPHVMHSFTEMCELSYY